MADDNIDSTAGAGSTRTAALTKEVRRTGLARQLIPMEAYIGWPIPLARDGRVYAKFVFYGGQPARREGVRAVLYPPFATVTMDWANARVVEYTDLRFKNPWPDGDWTHEAGTFPHDAVTDGAGRFREAAYLDDKARLFELYDALFEALGSDAELPAAATAELSTLLSRLMEPGLAPFYQAIAPSFCERFLAAPAPAGVAS